MKEKVILFGASSSGEKAYKVLREYYNIEYYCDNDKSKWGRYLNNTQILNPELLKEIKGYKIIITSDYFKEILTQLYKYNIYQCMIFKKVEGEDILFGINDKSITEYIFLLINKRIYNDCENTYITNLDDTEKKWIGDRNFQFINKVEDWIYYRNLADNNRIYKINLNGTNNMRIEKLKVLSTIIYNNRVSIVFNGNIRMKEFNNINKIMFIFDNYGNNVDYLSEIHENVLIIHFINISINQELRICINKEVIRDFADNELHADYDKRVIMNTKETDTRKYNSIGIYNVFPLNFSENISNKITFDNNNIPLYKFQNNFRYNPAVISGYGLHMYNEYLITGNNYYAEKSKKIADWIIDKIESKTGKIYYEFDILDEHCHLKAPWISAMAQGVVASLLSRVYIYTKTLDYLVYARQVLEPLKLTIERAGAKIKLGKYTFFEEYPSKYAPLTLNGFIYTLIGLYDFSCINKDDKESEKMFYEGVETLKLLLPFYDNEELSSYDLFHIFNSDAKPLLNDKYHKVHVQLLNIINSITPDEVFKYYYEIWKCKPKYNIKIDG